MAYVSGFSFGIISGVFVFLRVLIPGGIRGDHLGIVGRANRRFHINFLTSAFLTMAIVFLHTFWGIIFFAACEKRKPIDIVCVVSSHLLTSGLTFLNPRYEASLIPIYVVTLAMGVWAFLAAGGTHHNIRKCLASYRQPPM
ncbi:hypothetical protein GDO81_014791 [Engystomops pustulosus]|uniref:Gamma-secretase subunit APH-1 n=1 Tax=Engystomops pustulosus TaxID=76066 RepID=A0AAV7ALT0_ENGPU|nr:hypothetical protein GDO81_014791 [Engystomops pustulosus]